MEQEVQKCRERYVEKRPCGSAEDLYEERENVPELLIKEDRPLHPIAAFLPLVVPALLITVGSLGNMFFKDNGNILAVTSFIGDKTVAMLIGIIILLITCAARKDQLVDAARNSGSVIKSIPVAIYAFT